MYNHSLILYVNSSKVSEWIWTSKTKMKKYSNSLKTKIDEFYDEVHIKYSLSKNEKIIQKRIWNIKKSSHFEEEKCRRILKGLGIIYGYHLKMNIGYKDDRIGPAGTVGIYWEKISNNKDINDIGKDTKLYKIIPDELKNSLKEKRISVVSYLFWKTAVKEGNIDILKYLEDNNFNNPLYRDTYAHDELPIESLKWLLERKLLDNDKQLEFTCGHSETIEKVKILVPYCSEESLIKCLELSIDRFKGNKNDDFFNDNSDNIHYMYNYLKSNNTKISKELQDKISKIKIVDRDIPIDLVKPEYNIEYCAMFDHLTIDIKINYTTIKVILENVKFDDLKKLLILYAKDHNNRITRILDIRYNQPYFKIESFYSDKHISYTIYTIDERLKDMILSKYKPNIGLYSTTKIMTKILN